MTPEKLSPCPFCGVRKRAYGARTIATPQMRTIGIQGSKCDVTIRVIGVHVPRAICGPQGRGYRRALPTSEWPRYCLTRYTVIVEHPLNDLCTSLVPRSLSCSRSKFVD